ncbi:uncharacterized protein PGTG_14295 [Puccinia graminis f. sp. tritici CRL 75-36-700-3]|uniref:Zn(2)-C6 fungal-type domain-containing protein n=1 Tax=Puccinia graminis f. sp. tritici (strain CRL 75-36-700-3 / race SCCL) TaxID=418459 RepID=E3KVB6_PUCGT|nr:uncharacterized protein PGTG_14295 [Puccinia graminis f. sp. tritici CRL 75-36-700-3]EFP88211.2 hypothetical protein PGTG_14295 [Puccinia graminis f. sp. tritici CRL 75-36-700-3]
MPADRNHQQHQTTHLQSSSFSSSTSSTISHSSATSSRVDQERLPNQTHHDNLLPQEQQQGTAENSNVSTFDQTDSPTKKLKSKRFVSRPLQRNQACSTCRSRKVRCDAQKPACGACKRSAAAHGEDPTIIICQYDIDENILDVETYSNINHHLDFTDTTAPVRKPLAKIAALEQKIAEMETLISQLDLSLNSNPQPSSILCSGPSLSSTSEASSNMSLPSIPHSSSNPMEVVWTNWPSCLPPRRIISHLVKLYFSLQSGAGQLMFVEPAQLLASLHLPPSHPDFPFVGLLQSIMAVAYQQSVSGNPDQFAFNLLRACNIKRYWPMDSAVHHYHAKCAKRAIDQAVFNGTHLFQVTQSLNIYCYYAYGAVQLVQAWVCSGLAIQFATPLGLNQLEKCQEHLDRTKPKPRSLLPGPRTVVEKYQRAVTFWLAFQMDRFLSVSAGRPHSISESDITTLLPTKPGTSQATIGVVDLATNPLSISHPHFFSFHPYDVDEFQLELKATILLGRVSDWLIRAPDPVGFNLQKYWKMPDGPIPDLRSQPDFIQLDQDITTFTMSLPPKFHQTIFEGEGRQVSHGKVMIMLIINLSIILLHECFITKETFNFSFERCLQAASKIKWVGDLIFGSGYDCRLLHPFTNYCWAIAVRVMMRQLVQNEIKLIELATATTSTPPSQQLASSADHHHQCSAEPDQNQLIGLLKVEEDKVKQNLIEIESLLMFNRKIHNRDSKFNPSFHQDNLHFAHQTIQQSRAHQNQQQVEKHLIHQQPSSKAQLNWDRSFEKRNVQDLNYGYSFADSIDHHRQSLHVDQPIHNEKMSNPMTAHHHLDTDTRHFNPLNLGGNNYQLEPRRKSPQFDQPNPTQFLDQPVSHNLHESDARTQPDTDILNHHTLQNLNESPGFEELGLNQIYFDQLIVLFQIRFQAFRLPESLSRVVV